MAKPQNSTSSRRSAQKKHKETKSKKEETKTTPKKKETKPKPKKEETKPKKQQSKKEETKSKKKAESESKATKEVDAKKAGKMKKQPTATPESEAKDAASASPVHREKLRLFPARLVNPANVESMFPIAIPTAAAALKIAGDSARFDQYLAGAIDEVELVDYAAIGTTRHYTSEGADWESASNEDEVNEEIEENVEGPNPSKRGRSPTPSDCDAPNSPHGGDSPPRHRSPHRADVASLADDSQSSTSPSYSSDGSDSTSSSDLDASSDASS